MESDRAADLVLVPDVRGLELPEARRIAEEAGVVLAQPDPDGPPLAALTWPARHLVRAQVPAPGAVRHRWDSVVVQTQALDDGTAGDRVPRRPQPDPLRAAADPDYPKA